MEKIVLYALYKDEKMHNYLKENSSWYKFLNRNSNNYELFKKNIKKQYRLGVTDKISDTIDSLDLINTVIQTIDIS